MRKIYGSIAKGTVRRGRPWKRWIDAVNELLRARDISKDDAIYESINGAYI